MPRPQATDGPVVIAICADILMEEPLYTFFFSMLDCASRFLKVYFFYDGFSDDDLQRLEGKLRSRYNDFAFVFVEISPIAAMSWRGLHGNTFTFMKFFMPQHVVEDRMLYLDVDMVVGVDVAELYEQDLHGYTIGASGTSTIQWSLDTYFFGEIGLSQAELYFNAGMLLIDVAKWKRENVTERCVELANRYHTRFACHDQSVFNLLFYKNFCALPEHYNVALFPISEAPSSYPPAIYHFVGSPKPWDLGGRWLHSHYSFYEATLRRVGKTPVRFSLTKFYKKVRRSTLASRQYLRCIKNRLAPAEIG
jgi:UDP-glucose/galactose:(glucosyl)LPS alpha-1,2-glucosyl/galactosyltransferase